MGGGGGSDVRVAGVVSSSVNGTDLVAVERRSGKSGVGVVGCGWSADFSEDGTVTSGTAFHFVARDSYVVGRGGPSKIDVGRRDKCSTY